MRCTVGITKVGRAAGLTVEGLEEVYVRQLHGVVERRAVVVVQEGSIRPGEQQRAHYVCAALLGGQMERAPALGGLHVHLAPSLHDQTVNIASPIRAIAELYITSRCSIAAL